MTATVHLPAGSGLPAAVAELPTPCLVVEAQAMRRNIGRAVAMAGAVALRPHFKAHKCSRLMREQLAAGGCSGATCATVAEAGVLAAAGVDDVLVANEVVDRGPLESLVRLPGRITVAVDSVEGLERLARACAGAGNVAGVLVDLDVGRHRCGLDPSDPLVVELARRAHTSPGLELRGLMGYEGHAQHEPDPAVRAHHVAVATAALARTRDRLVANGLPCPCLSGGGTGTLGEQAAAAVVTEIQAGSYVLGDEQYAEVGTPFEQAVWCLATVISRRADCAVVNAGLKHLAGDDGPPRVAVPGAGVAGGLSDEHAIVRFAGPAPAIGDRLLLSPRHLDPTLNLHPRLSMAEPGGRLDEWEIDGRVR